MAAADLDQPTPEIPGFTSADELLIPAPVSTKIREASLMSLVTT